MNLVINVFRYLLIQVSNIFGRVGVENFHDDDGVTWGKKGIIIGWSGIPWTKILPLLLNTIIHHQIDNFTSSTIYYSTVIKMLIES